MNVHLNIWEGRVRIIGDDSRIYICLKIIASFRITTFDYGMHDIDLNADGARRSRPLEHHDLPLSATLAVLFVQSISIITIPPSVHQRVSKILLHRPLAATEGR